MGDSTNASSVEDMAEVLATQWLDASELNHRGRFSEEEMSRINAAIERYQRVRRTVLRAWSDSDRIQARAVPLRPLGSIYSYVRRARDSNARGGEWTQMDNAKLKRAVQKYGRCWDKVSDGLGRMAEDCRIQFSSLEHRDSEQRGHWTREEEAQLVEIIQDLGAEGRSETSQRIKWCVSAETMPAPALNQFRESQLKPAMLNGGQKRYWAPGDDYILVRKIASLHASSERDIDWGALKDPAWNA
ncbi:hypothetical protein BC834DRAFT_847255 [Gloeopeniophorella convolvens]|nr:hypothetical protein BC834DRAFT_847255 [Gloeopeniophorella convolvens]